MLGVPCIAWLCAAWPFMARPLCTSSSSSEQAEELCLTMMGIFTLACGCLQPLGVQAVEFHAGTLVTMTAQGAKSNSCRGHIALSGMKA